MGFYFPSCSVLVGVKLVKLGWSDGEVAISTVTGMPHATVTEVWTRQAAKGGL
jgi:hypothetical protein